MYRFGRLDKAVDIMVVVVFVVVARVRWPWFGILVAAAVAKSYVCMYRRWVRKKMCQRTDVS